MHKTRSRESLTPDQILQVVLGVVVVDMAFRFLGLFPGYGWTRGYGTDLACRLVQIALVGWMALKTYRRQTEAIGIGRPGWAADLAVGCAVAALIGAAVLAVRWALSVSGRGDLFDLLGMRGEGPWNLRLRWAALLRAGVGPLAEDLFFWGVVYNGLRGAFPFWKAALWVGIPYVLLHWQPGASWLVTVEPAVGTIFFAGLFEWRRSILATLPVHAGANLAILLVHRGVMFPV